MGALSGKVAVITGASRGVGKGIAVALGAEGATVYVTGRTVKPGSYWLPGTVGETAAEVTSRGGKGIAVQVDHGNDDQVAALFDQVKREQGKVDILVNNAFSLHDQLHDPSGFWEKPLDMWEMVNVGARSSYVAAWHAAKMMVPRKSGLIVQTSGYVGVTYTFGPVFGVCKAAADRMARDMAIELKPHNVASVSLWLALTFTERAEHSMKEAVSSGRAALLNRDIGSSPEFPGRVIAAFAKDPDFMKRTGGTYIAAEIANEYGVTDITGKVPPSVRATRGSPIWGPV